jgi:catechol 2,3-dioxygenase
VELPAATRMGPVFLTVADLDRSTAYYDRSIGLQVHARENGTARLGAGGEDLLVLTEQRGARPAEGFSGLFHFALLVPARPDLARFLVHATREDVVLTGVSDHAVSEAIYLRDPDQHGIEIYADRPREEWAGRVGELMTSMPLDTDDLLGVLEDPVQPFEGLAAGTVMGHVHLCVSDVAAAVGFYGDVLGFDLTARLGDQAAFFSAGGYHHHLAANSWQSRGAPYAPPDRARLTRATIVLPDDGALDAVAALESAERTADGVAIADPAGNPLLVTR